ncbi:CRISPR-associated endonuclease Cas2 [Zoogloea sp.]|uniref:CRISPR-associated endonuclease Cas2 n=1 Tax=Zoogloea sp. TaxID=49181 RepID=UPI0035B29C6F
MEVHVWVVSYDVADARARRALAEALEGMGRRVQHSVFECRMTVVEARFHLGRLAEGLDPATDSLRAYPLCAWCDPRVSSLGDEARCEDQRVWVV